MTRLTLRRPDDWHLHLRDGAQLTADNVRGWVAAALAPFKVPARVDFRDALPYTETGKVLKHQLKETYEK